MDSVAPSASLRTNAVRKTELAIEGMTCASCVGRVERALRAVPGVMAARVNLATERAVVEGGADSPLLIQAIDDAGYAARPIDRAALREADDAARKEAEQAALKRAVVVSIALTLPVVALEMGSHLVPGLHHLIVRTIGMQWNWIIQFALTTLVILGPGRRFYQQGFPALLRLAPDMNSLVAVGTVAAYAYSLVATFTPALLPAVNVKVCVAPPSACGGT